MRRLRFSCTPCRRKISREYRVELFFFDPSNEFTMTNVRNIAARLRRIAWLSATVALLGPTLSAAQTSPAQFSDGEKSLKALIEFPELRGDAKVAISCIGLLKDNGKLDSHGCYQVNPGDETFIAAIYKAAKKARLQPAVIDGKRVDVVFQYRVQFVQQGEDKGVQLVANPGHAENVEAYGSSHVAAQRVYGKDSWDDACPKQAKFIVLARANVDFDGTPGAVSVQHLNGINITEKCEQAIVDTILASRFIPAFADNEAVPSTFLEPFGN